MPQQFELNSNISVDCVIFGFDGEKLKVLLIEEKDIGQGMLRKRLPGDLILKNESLDAAADRVLYELATLRNVILKQFHTFGDPGRVNDPKDRKWLELYRNDPTERVITAAYYANDKLEVQKVNKNFIKFFPVLGNITNVFFPDVLEQLGVPEEQISQFKSELDKNGKVLIPQILINIDGEERIFSLLSAKTKSENFDYLNGVQGQFVDRTAEWE